MVEIVVTQLTFGLLIQCQVSGRQFELLLARLRCDAVTCVSTLDSCLRLRMAPCYVVRVSVSRGSEPDKDAGKPLLIRLSWVRPPPSNQISFMSIENACYVIAGRLFCFFWGGSLRCNGGCKRIFLNQTPAKRPSGFGSVTSCFSAVLCTSYRL